MPSLPVVTFGRGPRLVLAHGFTQHARAWGPFADLLSRHRTIVAVDLPGHGHAADLTEDVVGSAHALLDTVGDEPFDLLGYSMGGRIALAAAMMQPENLGALVLIGATPGISDASERRARLEADRALADALEASGDIEAFIDEWLAQPLFSGLTPATAQRDARIENSARGLAQSLRSMGTGTQQPAWGFLDMIDVPTLLLVGEHDAKFTALAHAMQKELSASTLAIAPGVAHACHLEAPEACADVVEAWLELVHPSASPSVNNTPTSN
jgi:2-succinyl-6-hydroxy-2,4-cyclohexadiene-1-carboxylate synthase